MTNRNKLLIIIAILCLFLSSCDGEEKHTETIDFASVSERESMTEEVETSRPVTLPDPEQATIPTLEEEPFSPELDLKFYNHFGLISEETNIGNLRDRPTTNGNIVGRFYSNTGMEILETLEGGWYHVTSGDLEGYVWEPLVKTGQDAIDQCIRYENYWVRVTSAALNVRMEPSTDSGIVARVREGQNYRILDEVEGWYKITIGQEEGYISKEFCKAGYTIPEAENWSQLDNISGNAKTVISYGMGLLGTRYVFGGNSTSGLDCSYFSLICMRQVGVGLPRLSKEQASTGVPVGSIYDALPGDLLFYNSHGRGIDHVAIYIGDNKILHAAQSIGCVSISVYNYCGEPVSIRRYF